MKNFVVRNVLRFSFGLFFSTFFFLFVGSSLRFGFFFCIFSFCFSSFCSYFPPCVLFMSRNRFGCEKLPSPCVVVLLILVLFAIHVCVCVCVYIWVYLYVARVVFVAFWLDEFGIQGTARKIGHRQS